MKIIVTSSLEEFFPTLSQSTDATLRTEEIAINQAPEKLESPEESLISRGKLVYLIVH